MTTSRRTILIHGGVIGFGAIAGDLSGVAALAAGALPKRVSLQGLAWNDPVVATYRDGVRIMKAMPEREKFSWVHLATIHGLDPDTDHFCPHGDWYFLPWHRAFVVMYERIIRHLTKNPAFAMPYWDWTTNPLMPEVFLEAKTPDGKPNALFVSEPGMHRTWPPTKPMPAEIVGPSVLRSILKATTFEQFGTSRNRMQKNLDPKWVPAGGGNQGILEASPHNQVHNNIGGWMPTMSSPRDPIFFMHHSNIDRIWALWNLHNANSKDKLWTDMPFKDNYYNVDGSFWSPKVSDLYSPEALGYTYDLPKPIAVAAVPTIEAFGEKLRTLNAAPDIGAAGAGIKTVVVQGTGTASAGAPLSLTADVGAGAIDAVRRRAPAGVGVEMVEPSLARDAAAGGTHVLAFLRDVAVTDPQTTMFRIFLDKPDVTADTPISDPHYVGTFGVFHHAMAEHGGMTSSFALDLTETLERIRGTLPDQSGAITLQLLPVSAEGTVGKVGTARPAQLEVSVVHV